MTVILLRWRVARPRRRVTAFRNTMTRNPRTARRERRPYQDPFFADPSAVEDDSRRMMRPGHQS